MTYLTVKDHKQTRKIWGQLNAERELVITRDGKPCAIMVEVSPENREESLAEIRRSLFCAAISRSRRKAAQQPFLPNELNDIIQESRKERVKCSLNDRIRD